MRFAGSSRSAAAAVAALAVCGCGAEQTEPAPTPREAEPAGCVNRAAFETPDPEDGGPSWSPDGRRIAFHSTRGGDYEVWTIDVETCEVTRLVPGLDPDWSPDGTRLVFARSVPGDQGISSEGLFSVASDGSDIRPLTRRPGDSFPAWSPQEDLIAFDHDALLEEVERRGIHVIRADGTGLRELTDGSWDTTPTFSPDGGWIAWTRSDAIWRMRSDGTEPEAVTEGEGNGDGEPSWSPDGATIAFTRSTFDIGLQPWLVELESGEERPLVDAPGDAPDWSPDGKWVVFVRTEQDGHYLSLVRPDGTGLRELTAPRL